MGCLPTPHADRSTFENPPETIGEQYYLSENFTPLTALATCSYIAGPRLRSWSRGNKLRMEVKRELWAEAADLERGDTSGTNYSSTGNHVSIEDVHAAVQNRLDECMRKRWKYIRSDGQKVVLWDVLNKIMKWVNKFKEVGDVAIQYDPGHAALPWAAIRFLLQASVGSVETFGHMLEGVELSSKIIATYAEVERTCLKGVSKLKAQLANALVKLYAGVLAFLSRARRYFGHSSGKRAFKGAFQSYQTSVDPWIEQINNAEKDVLKLTGLVQAEGWFSQDH